MSKTPRQRAEACFAVARSTTHEGERAAAISRGEFVCKRHGLNLNDFDIPGRVRKVPRGGMSGGSFDMDLDLVAEAFRRAGNSPYAPFQEFGTINRPAARAFWSVRCAKCGSSVDVTGGSGRCPSCG